MLDIMDSLVGDAFSKLLSFFFSPGLLQDNPALRQTMQKHSPSNSQIFFRIEGKYTRMRIGVGNRERWVMMLAVRRRAVSTVGLLSAGDRAEINTGTARPMTARVFPRIKKRANLTRTFFSVRSSVMKLFLR